MSSLACYSALRVWAKRLCFREAVFQLSVCWACQISESIKKKRKTPLFALQVFISIFESQLRRSSLFIGVVSMTTARLGTARCGAVSVWVLESRDRKRDSAGGSAGRGGARAGRPDQGHSDWVCECLCVSTCPPRCRGGCRLPHACSPTSSAFGLF